jgi:protoheme IX farnesyltransferase
MKEKEISQVKPGAGAFLAQRAREYVRLLKLRLSLLVVFSSVFGFFMAPNVTGFDLATVALLCIGGLMVTGASNIFNQILETDFDKLMSRTMRRPLPIGSVGSGEALTLALILGTGGILVLWISFGMTAALLSIIALLSYAFVYTPLKRVSSVAVLVGAFPGAMPPLIGWAAATGTLAPEALILFLIQFIWQFPHFWAIAWILDEDYRKAGFKMLPSGGGKTTYTAFIILIYTVLLVPVWILPVRMGMMHWITGAVMAGVSLLFTLQSLYLFRSLERKAARMLMFGSFIYLPVVQIGMLIDKF